jgi:hypothetical protein
LDTNYGINADHHERGDFKSRSDKVYSMQHYIM